jgi:hypothetical protein
MYWISGVYGLTGSRKESIFQLVDPGKTAEIGDRVSSAISKPVKG